MNTKTKQRSTTVETPPPATKSPARRRRMITIPGRQTGAVAADQIEGLSYGCVHADLRNGDSLNLPGGKDDVVPMARAAARGRIIDLTE